MTGPSTEATLMLVALGLYLGDSLMLLASDEAALVAAPRRWRPAFGANGFRLAGREPLLPNPLTPARPVFRLRWSFEAPAAAPPAARPVQVPAPLRALGVPVTVAALCLFVALPFVLFVQPGLVAALATVGVMYAAIGVALVGTWRHRAVFGLSRADCARLAFESLVCPPVAVNLVRRLALRLRPDETFVAAARRLLPDEDRASVDAGCLRRLDEQIDLEDEDSPRAARLVAARAAFARTQEPA